MAFTAAGCGGGQDEGQGGQGGQGGEGGGTQTQAKTGKGGPPKAKVIQDFEVDVASAQQARITATLARADELSLRVRRQEGENNTKVGKVKFGRKPAGPVTINWNLQVAGKPLPPGSYQVVLGGPAGNSERVEVTVPG